MFTNRDNIIVSTGNQALVAKDVKLFAANGTLNILPGQIGVFDAYTHKAVDNTNIAQSKDIYIAVGIDTNGDGVAEEIRKTSGEHWNKCSTDVAQVAAPRSECPEIWDFLFDCIECDTDYSLKVQTEGVEWMPYFANQHLPTFTFNHFATCCDDCEETVENPSCATFVTDILQQVAQTDNTGANLIDQQYPFDAIALAGNTTAGKTVTIDVPCRNNRPAAIKKLTISTTAGAGADAYGTLCTSVSGYPNILADGTINPGQLKTLATALMADFATDDNNVNITFYKACDGGCWKMVITGDDLIEVTLAEFLNADQVCGGSSTSATITTSTPLTVDGVDYSCGIRFIGHIFPQECGCFPPKEYKSTRGTRMRVFPLSGFDCKWDTNKVQDLQIAEGAGADIRWREYKQQTGGQGRTYDSYHMHYGKLGVYGDRVRESVTSECIDYCQYQFIYHAKSYPLAPMGWTNNTHLQSTVVIPNDDSTTKAAFETTINQWLVGGSCPLTTITCSNDNVPVINSGLNT